MNFQAEIYPIERGRFLTHWLLASVGVWVMGGLMAGFFAMLLIVPAMIFSPMLGNMGAEFGILSFVYMIVLVGAIGAGFAYAIGMLQRWLVDKNLFWDLNHWVRASVLGGFFGMIVSVFFASLVNILHYTSPSDYSVYSNYNDYNPGIQIASLVMVVFMFSVSLAQSFVLRRYVHHAWLWVAANVVGALLFGSVMANMVDPWGFFAWVAATLAQGAIIGIAMLWLLTALDKPLQTPVPVPVEAKATPSVKRSVWDEAI